MYVVGVRFEKDMQQIGPVTLLPENVNLCGTGIWCVYNLKLIPLNEI